MNEKASTSDYLAHWAGAATKVRRLAWTILLRWWSGCWQRLARAEKTIMEKFRVPPNGG